MNQSHTSGNRSNGNKSIAVNYKGKVQEDPKRLNRKIIHLAHKSNTITPVGLARTIVLSGQNIKMLQTFQRTRVKNLKLKVKMVIQV